MRPSVLLFFFIVSLLAPEHHPAAQVAAQADEQQDPGMDPREAAAVFDVLRAVNYDIEWSAIFPGDNPCAGGPHGLNCEVGDDDGLLHVAELNLGWVSEFVNNPPCSDNATIPTAAILRFTRLRKLFFYRCFVGEKQRVYIPEELGSISSMRHLVFQGNPSLVGRIPVALSELAGLERLVLSENGISGPIPPQLRRLRSLRQLVLSHNRLTGGVPAELGDLPELQILDLSLNQLSGNIPPRFPAGLLKLDLNGNRLTGGVPVALGAQLRFLDLSFNNLTGGIPASMSALPRLESLFLRGNPALGGGLPDFIGRLSELQMVALSGSGMSGTIPESIGQLRRLNSLALDANRLSGAVPASLSGLRSLYHLNLSSNLLSGELPFSGEFLGRLGRNLAVRDNHGLCSSSAAADSPVSVLGVRMCSEDVLGFKSHHVAATAASVAAPPTVSSAQQTRWMWPPLLVGCLLLAA